MTIETTLLAPPPANIHVASVLAVRHYSDGLFAFSCERPPSFRFRSGEFVMIGLMHGAKPLLRAYSIASPAWDETLSFYSIKVADGPLTSRLQHIREGDAVLLGRKPTGTLVLDALKPGRRLFLLSTGTGVAPFASLIRDPETYQRFDEVILTHTCRRADEIRYSCEQVELAFADPLVGEDAQAKLKLATSLTRDTHALTGRITDLIDDGRLFAATGLAPLDAAEDRVMICGSTPMLNDLSAIMRKRGFAEGANSAPGDFVYERAFVGR
jgi:ferredoxin--NADP+ reductase